LQLSASAIDTYQVCPQKYLFQQVWGIRSGPQAAMTFGNVMHTTIAQFVRELHKKRRMPFNELEAIYRREWSAAGFRDAYQEQEYQKAGLEQLQAFHRSYTAAPADVLYQEKYFALPVDERLVVTGRIDQVNQLGPREAEIVDYKTGKPKLEKDAQRSLQLSLYALAARDLLELEPARLTFYNLTTNVPVSATRDEKALDEAVGEVQEVAADIRAGRFPPQAGYHCRSCDFQPMCPAHEQLVSIQPASMSQI
jgi:RecB family exonuclease